MEVPDHNGVGYSRGAQGDAYRSRGQLQRHHTIQTCDDAYVSESPLLVYTDHTLSREAVGSPQHDKLLIKLEFLLYLKCETLQKGLAGTIIY